MSGESAVHWTSASLGSLGQIRLGKMLDKLKNTGSMVQYLRNVNVRWFQFDLSDMKSLRLSDAEQEMFSVRDGDLFICEGGEPGRCAVWHGGTNFIVYQKALHRFRTSGAIAPRFLMYQLRHQAYSGALQKAFSGTTIKHLTRESLSRHDVTLPPAKEQQRIADKLDAVLARVDDCRERLDRVPGILKRFRQSVLAAATSGDLTVEWKSNTASRSWSSKRLGEMAIEIKNGLSPKPAEQAPGTPILRINAVRPFVLRQDDLRFLRDIGNTSAYELRVDDLLFTRYSGSVELVGICARVREVNTPRLVYPDKLIRVRIDVEKALSSWIEIAVNAPAIREIIERTARTSAGQTGISGKDLKELEVPIPSLHEQAELVRRVACLFAWADRLEARHAAARTQVERLKPSLLAKAFRGELVPQDPADEPAAELLKRMTQRTAASSAVPPKQQGAKPHRASVSQTASNVREESPP